MRGRARAALALVAACASLGACVQPDLETGATLASLDAAYFRCEVEPVLVKRCAFAACHGSQLRPFRVYAPFRLRIGVMSGAALTDAEHAANFDMARAFADDRRGTPLLQRKALATAAGGSYHRGAEMFGGGDSFLTIDDPGYKAIVRWARDGEQADLGCTPVEDIGP